MKGKKKVEVPDGLITQQISTISYKIERDISDTSIDSTSPSVITNKIPKERLFNRHRNTAVESLELSPLPLGLMDRDLFDESSSASETQQSVRNQELSLTSTQAYGSDFEQKFKFSPGFLSRHRADTQQITSPNNNLATGVISDLSEYSSTTDLIPLSMAALKNEKSRRLLWLDNASLSAMSLTLSNIWRLPTFLYFNYPGEALIAYVILMTVVGLPLYVLELSLGQFGQTGTIQLWRAAPLFKGIGVAQLIAGLYQAFYLPTLMTWAFQFGVIGMGGWSKCDSLLDQNLTTCTCQEPLNNYCNLYGNISEEEACFGSNVLHEQGEKFNYVMLPMLALAMILITLSVSFGAKVMKTVLSLSGAVSAVLLCVILALALSHPNNAIPSSNNTARYGIELLTPSEPWNFGRGEVWYGAMVQVLFSLAIGFGTLPSQSCNGYFSRNIIREGIVTWLINMVFSIISIITIFAWIGISELQNADVVRSNAFVYFVFYNISGSLWAGLAFGLLFLAGINSMVPLVYGILQNFYQSFPALEKNHPKLISCLLGFFILLVNIPGLIPAGNEVVLMWDRYAVGVTVLTCVIFHTMGWSWVYGVENLKRDLECMILKSVSSAWKLFWGYFIMPLLIAALLWGFFGLPLDGTSDCLFPTWVVGAGWFFYLSALAIAFAITVKVVAQQAEYGLVKKLGISMKPDRNWGPLDPLFHTQWKRVTDEQFGTTPRSRGTTISNWLKDGEGCAYP